MRHRLLVALGVLAVTFLSPVEGLRAAGGSARKPLDPNERVALLSLMNAVDRAQDTNALADAALSWDNHVLKAANETAYVPFRVTLNATDSLKSAAMYVRVVSRHDGFRATGERSAIRDWVLHGMPARDQRLETVPISPEEMPIGGPAVGSSRRTTQAPAAASAVLALQQQQYEKAKAAEEAAKKKLETKQRDPDLFPFEEYYFFDLKARSVERALAVPSGEYDVYVALVDRSRVKTSSPTVVRNTITVPDFWNDQLTLSSLILVSTVRALKAPLGAKDQREHPYAFGVAEVVPVTTATFSADDVLSVVYQVCNYGAPDSDVSTEYNFYRDVDGKRTLFNRTEPQQLTDADLPPPTGWQTQGFVMQTVPLQPFPPGRYELEIVARDRLTRSMAKATAAFSVAATSRRDQK
jgi:hypothetical protein